METVLGWIGLVVGAAGAVVGAVDGRRREAGDVPRSLLWPIVASLLGVLVVFLLTLPYTPPLFSAGLHLGYGALIGGILGVVACFLALRSSDGGGFSAITAPSIALFGVSLTLMLFASDPSRAFAGFLIGAIIPGVIFRLGADEGEATDLWTAPGVLLGATIWLAILRYDTVDVRVWWRAPIVMMAAVIITFFIGRVFYRPGRGFVFPAAMAAALTIGLSAIFAWKLFPNWSLLGASVAGVVTLAICVWLAKLGPDWSPAPAGAALMVIALSAVNFRLLAGFGIGIGLLAGLSVLVPALAWGRRETGGENRVTSGSVGGYVIFIDIGMLFLRLFLDMYADDLRGFDIRPHYALVAVALGAVFPFVLTSFFPVGGRRGDVWRSLEAGAAGVFAAAAPLVILTVWGMKSVLGFLVGLIAATIFLLFAYMGAAVLKNRQALGTAALSVTAGISAVVLSGLVSPLAEETRSVKVLVLGAVVVLGLVWAVIAGLVERRTVGEG